MLFFTFSGKEIRTLSDEWPYLFFTIEKITNSAIAFLWRFKIIDFFVENCFLYEDFRSLKKKKVNAVEFC